MNILLSAYACHPCKGSEQGIGWNWLKEIAETNRVWALIYSGDDQAQTVRKAVEELPCNKNISIIAIGVPKFFEKRFYRIRYEIWQWKALRKAKKIIKERRIDLVHHVTIAAWWNCGHLWKINVPFIFGPLSGAQKIPRVAYSFLRFRDRFSELMRDMLFDIAWYIWRRPRGAIKKARVVFVSNPETRDKVQKLRKGRPVILLSDVGVSQIFRNGQEFRMKSNQNKSILLLWAGALITRKNFGLLLDAVAALPKEIPWILQVAGTGKLLNHWQQKVYQLGLKTQVVFLGNCGLNRMPGLYQCADIFVFPSLREATGSVLIEAMSQGLPIIALQIHGAQVILDESCAILISVKNRKQMVRDFRDAIIKLSGDPELRRRMGEAGKEKAEKNYLWEKRGKRMHQVYEETLNLINKCL